MKNIVKRFVDEYKAILDMKNIYNYNNFTFKTIKNVVIYAAIQCLLFIGVGYIFNLLKNIHYIFISTNILVIGTFIIYRVTKELQFKNHYKIEYKVLTALIYDFLYLSTVLCIVNELLVFILFGRIISIAYTITLLTIGIILLIIYFVIDYNYYFNEIKIKHHLRKTNILTMIIVITLEYILLLYALDIRSIVLAYLTATIIVIILNILKQRNYVIRFFNTSSFNFLSFILITLFSLSVIYTDNLDEFNMSDFISGEIVYTNEINVEIDDTCLFDNGIDYCFEFFASDEHLYLINNETLYQYDNNLNLLKTYDPPFEDLVRYYVYDYQVYAIQSDNSVPDTREYARYGSRYVAYNITDPNNIIELNAFYAERDWFEESIVFYDNHFASIREVYETVSEEMVFYQDNDRFAYHDGRRGITNYHYYLREGDTSFFIYSNNYICYDNMNIGEGDDETKGIMLFTVEYFINNQAYLEDPIIIEQDTWNLEDFYFDGEYFYFVDSTEIFVYNKDLDFVNNIKIHEDFNSFGEYSSIYISDAGAFYINTNEIDSFSESRIYTIKSVDMESLNTQLINAESRYFNSLNLYLLLGTLLLFKIKFPYLERGVDNE